jgi:hypothetical protein
MSASTDHKKRKSHRDSLRWQKASPSRHPKKGEVFTVGTIRGPWFNGQHPKDQRYSFAVRTNTESWDYALGSSESEASKKAVEKASHYIQLDKAPFTKRYLGPSSDGRTNKWELTCQCGKVFVPPTTMLARREEQCPKCGRVRVIDYNS